MTETPWYRRLREIAKLAGDSDQQSIAIRLGVSNAAVTGWKQGTLPTWQNILNAARAYGQEPHALLIAVLPEFAPYPAPKPPLLSMVPKRPTE